MTARRTLAARFVILSTVGCDRDAFVEGHDDIASRQEWAVGYDLPP